MNKLVTYINRGLAAFTISLSSFLVFCVVWQVLSRYVLGKPSTVTDELARYLFMWVALIGAAYTTGRLNRPDRPGWPAPPWPARSSA